MKAIDAIPRFDLRRRRADQLFAAIVHKVGHLVEDKREFRNLLLELLHSEGVEIITDSTRAEVGLPPRGIDGWTDAEIRALDLRRLDHLLQPLVGPSLKL